MPINPIFTDRFKKVGENLEEKDNEFWEKKINTLYHAESLYYNKKPIENADTLEYLLYHSREFIDFYEQYKVLTQEIVSWCNEHHIRDEGNQFLAFQAMDNFIKRLFNANDPHNYGYGEIRTVLNINGKKYLEQILILLRHDAIPLADKQAVLIDLLKNLNVCGPGCVRNIQEAVFSLKQLFANNLESSLSQYKEKLAVKLAVESYGENPFTHLIAEIISEDVEHYLIGNEIHIAPLLIQHIKNTHGIYIENHDPDQFSLGILNAIQDENKLDLLETIREDYENLFFNACLPTDLIQFALHQSINKIISAFPVTNEQYPETLENLNTMFESLGIYKIKDMIASPDMLSMDHEEEIALLPSAMPILSESLFLELSESIWKRDFFSPLMSEFKEDEYRFVTGELSLSWIKLESSENQMRRKVSFHSQNWETLLSASEKHFRKGLNKIIVTPSHLKNVLTDMILSLKIDQYPHEYIKALSYLIQHFLDKKSNDHYLLSRTALQLITQPAFQWLLDHPESPRAATINAFIKKIGIINIVGYLADPFDLEVNSRDGYMSRIVTDDHRKYLEFIQQEMGKVGLMLAFIRKHGIKNFSYFHLKNAVIEGVDLFDITFIYVNLENAAFIGTALHSLTFLNSNLSGAIFRPLMQKDGSEKPSSLDLIVFRSSALNRIEFEKCSLHEVGFHDSEIRNTRISKESVLENTHFSQIRLTNSKFIDSTFIKVTFTDSSILSTLFQTSTFDTVNFSRIKLSGSRFYDVQVRHSDFSFAILQNTEQHLSAIFHASYLEDINFSGARLKGVFFNKVKFKDVSFRYADLTAATFHSLSSEGILNLDTANLSHMDFQQVSLTDEHIAHHNLQFELMNFLRLAPTNQENIHPLLNALSDHNFDQSLSLIKICHQLLAVNIYFFKLLIAHKDDHNYSFLELALTSKNLSIISAAIEIVNTYIERSSQIQCLLDNFKQSSKAGVSLIEMLVTQKNPDAFSMAMPLIDKMATHNMALVTEFFLYTPSNNETILHSLIKIIATRKDIEFSCEALSLVMDACIKLDIRVFSSATRDGDNVLHYAFRYLNQKNTLIVLEKFEYVAMRFPEKAFHVLFNQEDFLQKVTHILNQKEASLSHILHERMSRLSKAIQDKLKPLEGHSIMVPACDFSQSAATSKRQERSVLPICDSEILRDEMEQSEDKIIKIIRDQKLAVAKGFLEIWLLKKGSPIHAHLNPIDLERFYFLSRLTRTEQMDLKDLNQEIQERCHAINSIDDFSHIIPYLTTVNSSVFQGFFMMTEDHQPFFFWINPHSSAGIRYYFYSPHDEISPRMYDNLEALQSFLFIYFEQLADMHMPVYDINQIMTSNIENILYNFFGLDTTSLSISGINIKHFRKIFSIEGESISYEAAKHMTHAEEGTPHTLLQLRLQDLLNYYHQLSERELRSIQEMAKSLTLDIDSQPIRTADREAYFNYWKRLHQQLINIPTEKLTHHRLDSLITENLLTHFLDHDKLQSIKGEAKKKLRKKVIAGAHYVREHLEGQYVLRSIWLLQGILEFSHGHPDGLLMLGGLEGWQQILAPRLLKHIIPKLTAAGFRGAEIVIENTILAGPGIALAMLPIGEGLNQLTHSLPGSLMFQEGVEHVVEGVTFVATTFLDIGPQIVFTVLGEMLFSAWSGKLAFQKEAQMLGIRLHDTVFDDFLKGFLGITSLRIKNQEETAKIQLMIQQLLRNYYAGLAKKDKLVMVASYPEVVGEQEILIDAFTYHVLSKNNPNEVDQKLHQWMKSSGPSTIFEEVVMGHGRQVYSKKVTLLQPRHFTFDATRQFNASKTKVNDDFAIIPTPQSANFHLLYAPNDGSIMPNDLIEQEKIRYFLNIFPKSKGAIIAISKSSNHKFQDWISMSDNIQFSLLLPYQSTHQGSFVGDDRYMNDTLTVLANFELFSNDFFQQAIAESEITLNIHNVSFVDYLVLGLQIGSRILLNRVKQIMLDLTHAPLESRSQLYWNNNTLTVSTHSNFHLSLINEPEYLFLLIPHAIDYSEFHFNYRIPVQMSVYTTRFQLQFHADKQSVSIIDYCGDPHLSASFQPGLKEERKGQLVLGSSAAILGFEQTNKTLWQNGYHRLFMRKGVKKATLTLQLCPSLNVIIKSMALLSGKEQPVSVYLVSSWRFLFIHNIPTNTVASLPQVMTQCSIQANATALMNPTKNELLIVGKSDMDLSLAIHYFFLMKDFDHPLTRINITHIQGEVALWLPKQLAYHFYLLPLNTSKIIRLNISNVVSVSRESSRSSLYLKTIDNNTIELGQYFPYRNLLIKINHILYEPIFNSDLDQYQLMAIISAWSGQLLRINQLVSACSQIKIEAGSLSYLKFLKNIFGFQLGKAVITGKATDMNKNMTIIFPEYNRTGIYFDRWTWHQLMLLREMRLDKNHYYRLLRIKRSVSDYLDSASSGSSHRSEINLLINEIIKWFVQRFLNLYLYTEAQFQNMGSLLNHAIPFQWGKSWYQSPPNKKANPPYVRASNCQYATTHGEAVLIICRKFKRSEQPIILEPNRHNAYTIFNSAYKQITSLFSWILFIDRATNRMRLINWNDCFPHDRNRLVCSNPLTQTTSQTAWWKLLSPGKTPILFANIPASSQLSGIHPIIRENNTMSGFKLIGTRGEQLIYLSNLERVNLQTLYNQVPEKLKQHIQEKHPAALSVNQVWYLALETQLLTSLCLQTPAGDLFQWMGLRIRWEQCDHGYLLSRLLRTLHELVLQSMYLSWGSIFCHFFACGLEVMSLQRWLQNWVCLTTSSEPTYVINVFIGTSRFVANKCQWGWGIALINMVLGQFHKIADLSSPVLGPVLEIMFCIVMTGSVSSLLSYIGLYGALFLIEKLLPSVIRYISKNVQMPCGLKGKLPIDVKRVACLRALHHCR